MRGGKCMNIKVGLAALACIGTFAVSGHSAWAVEIGLSKGGCLGTGIITIAAHGETEQSRDVISAPAEAQPSTPEKEVFHCENTHPSPLAVCRTSQ